MLRAFVIGAALVVTAASAVVAELPKRASGLTYVSADQVREWTASGVPLAFVDVRAEDEFEAGRLPGSVNAPVTKLPESAKGLPKDRRLLVYCIHSAHRAPQVASQLKQLGFEDFVIVEGGLTALVEAGFKLEAGAKGATPQIMQVMNRCEDAAADAAKAPPK